MQQYNRSWQSRKANNQGHMFENMIEQGCEYYRKKGVAEISKVPEFFKVTRTNRDGTFEGRFLSNAQPDFQGTLAGGKSIVFEAKYTSTDRINQGVITSAQESFLNYHADMGGYCGVCVGIKKTYAFIPWKDWKRMKDVFGRKYMKEDEIEMYSVKTPGMILFLDYEKRESQKNRTKDM